ncbi:MAG: pentapeptide repeat-containing protein [Pseudomonadota bacterium]
MWTRGLVLAGSAGAGLAALVLVLLRVVCAETTGPLCGGLAAGPPWLFLWLVAVTPAGLVLWVHAHRLRARALALQADQLALERERLQLAQQGEQRARQAQLLMDDERRSATSTSGEREAAERFAASVALLGTDKVEARLGAIYALELVAQDSARFCAVVVETLAAFVRQAAPLPLTRDGGLTRAAERPGEDVSAALAVLGRLPRAVRSGGSGVDLSCTNLRRASLAGGNFAGFNFKRALLRCADLEGADLHGANLSYAELSGDLRETDLDKIDRFDPRWVGASLRGVDLRGADLSHADLRGARLGEARLGLLDEADAGSGAELYDADLRWADLSKADLAGARLMAAKLRSANLSEASLQRANLSKAVLVDANLQRCDLLEANLTRADLTGARLRGVAGLLAKQLESASSYARAELDDSLAQRLKDRLPTPAEPG